MKIYKIFDFYYWYVKKGAYWATVQVVGDRVDSHYATYHLDELMHYQNSVRWCYNNESTPSIRHRDQIVIPDGILDKTACIIDESW